MTRAAATLHQEASNEDGTKLEASVQHFVDLLVVLGRRALRDPLSLLTGDLSLTQPQTQTLMWLNHDGQLTMGQIAQRVGVTEKTVTGIVDRLEREGHLLRERDEADRRVIFVRLTESGTALADSLRARLLGRIRDMYRLLDAEECRVMDRVVQKLRRWAEESKPGVASD